MTDLEKACALAANFAGARLVEIKDNQVLFAPLGLGEEQIVSLPVDRISSDRILSAISKVREVRT